MTVRKFGSGKMLHPDVCVRIQIQDRLSDGIAFTAGILLIPAIAECSLGEVGLVGVTRVLGSKIPPGVLSRLAKNLRPAQDPWARRPRYSRIVLTALLEIEEEETSCF